MEKHTIHSFLLIGIVIVVTSPSVESFNPNNFLAFLATNPLTAIINGPTRSHKAITEQACLRSAQEALLEEGLIGGRVNPDDLDASSLVQRAFGAEASARDFQRVINEIGKANADVDFDEAEKSEAHFDAENFIEGNRRLLNLRSTVIGAILREDFESARVAAGQFFHTLQDFYSHSNWLELGHRSPNPDLGKPGRRPTNIAPPNSPTCVDCHTFLNPLNVGTCTDNLIDSDESGFLTSGYFSGQDIPKPDASTLTRSSDDQGKCSHGGLLDGSRGSTANGGINKDTTAITLSPHWYLHSEAVEVAIAASFNFLEDIRKQVGNTLFLRFKGLDYGASLSFCIDTTGSMGDDIAEVRLAVNQIIDFSLAGGTVPSEFVLAEFNDPGVGPVFVTSDPDEFRQAIAAIVVSGGGDFAELAISGLILALQASRPRSTIYLFTDATAKDFNRFPEALTLIFEKRIQVIVIRTGGFRRRRETVDEATVFDLIAESSGGQVLTGARSDVSELLTITSSFTAASDVTLASIDSPTAAFPPDGHNWTVPIDSSLINMTFSLSGSAPSVSLFDKDGNRILVDPSNVVELAASFVVRLPSPSVGDLTVQVTTTSPYTLRVKGLSTLEFEHSFVVPVVGDHSGLLPIRGLPRTGDSVFVQLTLVGLTPDRVVREVFFQSDNGTVISRHTLLQPNDTDNEFITESAVVIPSGSFLVGISGEEVSVGAPFRRIDPTLVTPTRFQLDIDARSGLVLRQGTTSFIQFVVRNGPDAPSDSFTFVIDDDLDFAGTPSPTGFGLAAGENQTIVVPFFVPPCYPPNGIDTVTATVTSDTTSEFNSFVLRIIVDSEFADTEAPVCALRSVFSGSCPGIPDSTTWTAVWDVLDRSSAIFQIVAQSNNTVVSYSESAAESSNVWISVTTTILCVDDEEILTITDLSGNVANCSVTQSSPVPVCSLGCLNGGRCVSTDECECPGGFHGDRCQYDGCPSPPVPESGRVSTGPRNYSVGDAVEWVCDDDHELVGRNTTTCCPSGWTGTVPQCVGSCSWSSWSECSVTCGRGRRTRVATGPGCTQPSSEECIVDTDCDVREDWKGLFTQYVVHNDEYEEGCPDP